MLLQSAATEKDLASRLHPRRRHWFGQSFPAFTHAPLFAVPAILDPVASIEWIYHENVRESRIGGLARVIVGSSHQ
jgi:hypothetical protein